MLRRIKKFVLLLVAILVAIPFLSACGATQGNVNVTLGIFKIDMPATIKAGQVTFHITNDDTSDTHEFLIFKSGLAPGKLPLDSNSNVDVTAPGLTKIGGIAPLSPGESKDLTVTLDPGKYVALCNLPGHYEAGMFAGFTVQ
jgi:uncharacterized cupredoxin-like copper-binding protein